jgi:hypothetical protein
MRSETDDSEQYQQLYGDEDDDDDEEEDAGSGNGSGSGGMSYEEGGEGERVERGHTALERAMASLDAASLDAALAALGHDQEEYLEEGEESEGEEEGEGGEGMDSMDEEERLNFECDLLRQKLASSMPVSLSFQP